MTVSNLYSQDILDISTRTSLPFDPKLERVDKKLIYELLQKVQKPGRYIGAEFGIPKKHPEDHFVKVVLSYPDVYELGMSNEGLKILYDQLHRNGFFCDRVFLPWSDFGALLKEYEIPLYSLDHFLKITSFDVWGFNVAHELNFTNILYALDLAHIPLLRSQRRHHDPFIICGGTAVSNPLPLFDFVDGVFMGDGEEAIIEIVKVIENGKKQKKPRKEILKDLQNVEGLVIPEFYQVIENPSGYPTYLGKRVQKRTYRSEEFANLEHIVIPNIEITQDRTVLEVNRGCGQGCRFCHAGFWKRPVRNVAVERLIEIAGKLLRKTGNNVLTLHSLSIANYPWLEDLVIGLAKRYGPEGVSLSLPSLRVQVNTIPILEMTSDIRKSNITFALEAGSEFLREKIHKKVSEENLHYLISLVYQKGWDLVKVYFMLGLPDSRNREVDDLIRSLNALGKLAEEHGKRKKVNVTVSLFVPKPFTTFQWEEQKPPEYFEEAIQRIKNEVRSKRVWVRHPSPWMAYIEGLLSRGDHRVGEYLLKAYQKGAKFDSWDDGFREDIWREIMEEIPVSLKTLWLGKKHPGTPMPWEDVVDGFPIEKLLRDYEKFEAITEENINPVKRELLDPSKYPPELFKKVSIPKEKMVSKSLVKLTYAKIRDFVYISHLDTVEVFRKALRRAKFPMTFTSGFNKTEKLHTTNSLPLYVHSLKEELYLHSYKNLHQEALSKYFEEIENNLPEDLILMNLEVVKQYQKPKEVSYRLEFRDQILFENIYKKILQIFSNNQHAVLSSNGKPKIINILHFELCSQKDFIQYLKNSYPNSERIKHKLYFDQKDWLYGIHLHLPEANEQFISLSDLVTQNLEIPKSQWNVYLRVIKL
ncbi:MAG: TIGR03960 family B12-binding radical SAM protein [Leptospiraceae bacterium]|nr:TIGR03960 family B12-binding radical SAM protein [Leptospiraceae bacterium]